MFNSAVTWLEISTKALFNNLRLYQKIALNALVVPVIKSNAYGHGLAQIASLLQSDPTIEMLAVVSLREAYYLRQIGITKKIVVLSILDDSLEKIPENEISIIVSNKEIIKELNSIGCAQSKQINIHLKIDTGLSRNGVLYSEAMGIVSAIKQLSNLKLEGIFTHFANSESEDQTFTQLQLDRFEKILCSLTEQSIAIPYKHTSCSAALSAHTASHYNLARLGIGLYGLWPSPENKKITQRNYSNFNLIPVMTWKTRLIAMKKLPAFSYVGYDLTFRTQKDSTIGLLPIGYWDGYDRELSNRGTTIIKGKYAPIVGRISMNLAMVDLTDIPEALIGDEVILMGSHDNVTADDLARKTNTINYEIVTRINPLLPRIIVD